MRWLWCLVCSITGFMSQKHARDLEQREAVEQGRKNLALIPRIEDWCEHLDIKLEYSGLLATIYQLPIGSMAIDCPHAGGLGISAMNLNEVATHFVINNCINCPHHREIKTPNFGQLVLGEKAKREAEEESSVKPADSSSKQEVLRRSRGKLDEALLSSDISEQSILELVGGLDDPEKKLASSEKLLEATHLRPEFFTPCAIEVICEHFSDLDTGRNCISTVRNVLPGNQPVPEYVLSAAAHALTFEWGEPASFFIARWLQLTSDPCPPGAIHLLLNTQHAPARAFSSGKLQVFDSPEGAAALAIIAERWPLHIVNEIRVRLRHHEPNVRRDSAYAIEVIMEKSPSIGRDFIESLLSALELPDNHEFSRDADTWICRALAVIFVHFPSDVEKALAVVLSSADEEMQTYSVKILNCVLDLAIGKTDMAKTASEPIRSKALALVPTIIRKSLQICCDQHVSLECRQESVRVLQRHDDDCSGHYSEFVEPLLGAVAQLAVEEAAIADRKKIPDQPQPNHFDQVFQMRLKDGLIEVLDSVANTHSRIVFEAVRDMLSRLKGSDTHISVLWAALLELFAKIAKTNKYYGEAVPELYRALANFSCAWVRGSGVSATVEVFGYHTQLIPDTMMKLLVLHLQDPYVHVHKQAIGAFRDMWIEDNDLQIVVCLRLKALWQAYGDNPEVRADVLAALLHVCRDNKQMWRVFACLPSLEMAISDEPFRARPALRALDQHFTELSDSQRVSFVRAALDFIERDRIEHGDELSQSSFILRLFDLDQRTVSVTEPDMLKSVKKLGGQLQYPYAALIICQALAHQGYWKGALTLIQALHDVLPDVAKWRAAKDLIVALAAVYEAEAFIAGGDVGRGLPAFKMAHTKLITYVENEKTARSGASCIKPFLMASSVARSIEGVQPDEA
jgi:hypothetical protein